MSAPAGPDSTSADRHPNHVELWLVRHGESQANIEGRFSGWSNVPLSSLGQQQASSLRPFLQGQHFDSVWASDLQRALDTARLAYGEARIDERLREMHFGTLEGSVWEDSEHSRALLKFVCFEPPGGETLESFRARVLGFVAKLEPGRHLLFTHGGVIRSLAVHLGVDRFVGNAGCLVIDWTAQQIIKIHEPYAPSAYVRGE